MQSLISQPFQWRLVWVFHALALVLVALHLYVGTLPPTPEPLPGPADAESYWWGLWPATYVPGWLRWTGAAVVVASMGWGWWVGSRDRSEDAGNVRSAWLWGGAVLLFVAFWLFPIVHTRWGDAYILANAIGWPDPALRLTHSWQAPLDVYLHSRVWHWLHMPLHWTGAVPVYRLLSPLAGALYLWVVMRLAADRRLAPNWITFGLLTSLGLIQLFFGYVENYSFAAAGILAYLWLGLGVLNGERPLWLAAAVLALTNATHPSTVVYTPSLLYLGWYIYQENKRRSFVDRQTDNNGRQQTTDTNLRPKNYTLSATVRQIALPMFLIGLGTFTFMELSGHGLSALFGADRPGGGDGRWLVPLFATSTRWERYTLLSWPHLRDILNEQLLVAPVVLPALLIAWIGTIGRQKRLDSVGELPAAQFLAWAAGCHLLLIWLWNPDYGGQRDWDLFSLASIPNTLLLIWALPRVLPDAAPRRVGVIPLILLQALHTAAWLYQNRLPWQWPA